MTLGDEVVFRVSGTGTGMRVVRYDGRGLRDGLAGKHICRYWYGDDAAEKATAYAEEKVRSYEEDGESARLVKVGERL